MEHGCFKCGKSFKNKFSLVQHERIHTDTRPYGCTECGKRFRQMSDLSQHVRIHRNQKPFACYRCHRSFRQRSSLNQHLRNKHSDFKMPPVPETSLEKVLTEKECDRVPLLEQIKPCVDAEKISQNVPEAPSESPLNGILNVNNLEPMETEDSVNKTKENGNSPDFSGANGEFSLSDELSGIIDSLADNPEEMEVDKAVHELKEPTVNGVQESAPDLVLENFHKPESEDLKQENEDLSLELQKSEDVPQNEKVLHEPEVSQKEIVPELVSSVEDPKESEDIENLSLELHDSELVPHAEEETVIVKEEIVPAKEIASVKEEIVPAKEENASVKEEFSESVEEKTEGEDFHAEKPEEALLQKTTDEAIIPDADKIEAINKSNDLEPPRPKFTDDSHSSSAEENVCNGDVEMEETSKSESTKPAPEEPSTSAGIKRELMDIEDTREHTAPESDNLLTRVKRENDCEDTTMNKKVRTSPELNSSEEVFQFFEDPGNEKVTITRKLLEEIVLHKLSELLIEVGDLGYARNKAEASENERENLIKQKNAFLKTRGDQRKVVRKFTEDKRTSKNYTNHVIPAKVTRSVGLQVCTVGHRFMSAPKPLPAPSGPLPKSFSPAVQSRQPPKPQPQPANFPPQQRLLAKTTTPVMRQNARKTTTPNTTFSFAPRPNVEVPVRTAPASVIDLTSDNRKAVAPKASVNGIKKVADSFLQQALANAKKAEPQPPFPPVAAQQYPPNTVLPPKPTLRISRTNADQKSGIMLSWYFTEKEATPISKFQVYSYQEGSDTGKDLWKKVGDVDALVLPMACTLTQFKEGYKYYFSVRAIDKNSIKGPFSEPNCIKLFPRKTVNG